MIDRTVPPTARRRGGGVHARLIRHGIHLHPLAVIVAVPAGFELGGGAGIFLAIPAVAIVSVTYRHWLDWHGDGEGPSGATQKAHPAAEQQRQRNLEKRTAVLK
jgi:hypothetical protein